MVRVKWLKIVLKCLMCMTAVLSFPLAIEARGSEVTEETIIEAYTEAGTYPVTVRLRGSDGEITSEETYYVTITYPRTVVSEQHGEAIDAYDIRISKKLLQRSSESTLITLAKARAWDTSTGETKEVFVKKINKNPLSQKTITFTTANSTETTIHILLEEDNTMPRHPQVEEQVLYTDIQYFMPTYLVFGAIVFLILIPIICFFFIFIRTKKQFESIEQVLYEKIE